jgi:hypothetical protein
MNMPKIVVCLLLMSLSGGCSIGYEAPNCIALQNFDSWRVHDRTRVSLFKQGQNVGTVEIVESMAGGYPLYLTHKIWFEARDHQLCGQRDIVLADGRRMHISQVIPVITHIGDKKSDPAEIP